MIRYIIGSQVMLILRGVEGNVEAEHTQYSRGHQLLRVNAKVCISIDPNKLTPK